MDDRAPFASLLQLQMTRQSLTLQDVADRVQCASGHRSRVTRHLVSRWRSGAVTPSPIYVRWLCDALGVELPMFARAAAAQRPGPLTAPLIGPLQLSISNTNGLDYPSVTADSPQQIVSMDNLLVADNGVLVPWEISDEQLHELERIHASLNARSEVEPPQLIAPELRNWLGTLRKSIRTAEPEQARCRLQAMAARTACHLGYLAFRELDLTGAFDHYAVAEALARDAHDDLELSLILLRKQRLYRSSAASEIVDSLAQLAKPGWPSGITAWVWSERARLDAAAGRGTDARHALESAMSAAASDPDHLNLFAPGRDSRWLARRPAWVALHLGHSQEAITIIERNRAGADESLPREMVWNSIELAEAWAEHGDLDNALGYLDDALDRAEESADRRGAGHVLRVRSRRLTQWGNDPRLRQVRQAHPDGRSAMKYRKRPIVIHALQWTGDNAAEIKAFVGQRPSTAEPAFLLPQEAPDRGWDEAHFWTEAEGSWDRCPIGHWVVQGVMGEFYPHHPDSFARTYEPVEAEQETPSRSR